MKSQQSELKIFKSGNYEFIYLYFKHKGNILRINTGNKPIKSGMLKDLLYNSSVTDHKAINERTTELKQKVDGYIEFKLNSYNSIVNQKECLEYISTSDYVKGLNGKLLRLNDFTHVEQSKTIKTVMNYYNDFLIYKTKEVVNASSYHSLKLNLENFQTYRGNELTFEYVSTKDFIVDFREYLSGDKINMLKHQYLNTNSVNIKLTQLKTFLNWINDSEIFVIKPSVFKFKNSVITNEAIALTKTDLLALQALVNLKEHEQKIVDVFLFNCFAGLRFSDLMILNKNNINKHNENEYYIVLTNKKTGTEAIIQLQKTSLDILQKYDWNLPKTNNANFNKHLKMILVKYNLFSDLVTIQKRENNSVKDIKVMRRLLVSSHTARKTFVNLCFENNVPINQIMKATAHKNISTLQKYMQKVSSSQAFKGIDIDAA
jgi:integrase